MVSHGINAKVLSNDAIEAKVVAQDENRVLSLLAQQK